MANFHHNTIVFATIVSDGPGRIWAQLILPLPKSLFIDEAIRWNWYFQQVSNALTLLVKKTGPVNPIP